MNHQENPKKNVGNGETRSEAYGRLINLAREVKTSHVDESAPPYFVARIAARAMAERRAAKTRVSPWDIVGWRALAAAFSLAAVAVLWSDVSVGSLWASWNDSALLFDDSCLIQVSTVEGMDIL